MVKDRSKDNTLRNGNKLSSKDKNQQSFSKANFTPTEINTRDRAVDLLKFDKFPKSIQPRESPRFQIPMPRRTSSWNGTSIEHVDRGEVG